MKKKIIIDTDPGIDDAFALLYAMKNPSFDILGISTVSGNNGIDRVTKNTLKLVKYMDREIEVYSGEAKPYARKVDQGDSCHGDDGLGGAGNGLEYGKVNPKHAVDFIIEMAGKHKDLTLVTLGPLTNIARAIDKNPQAMKNIVEIVSMGGGIDRGNVTSYAEFNYWADPEACKLVFDFDIPITMVGLNATNHSMFTMDEFDFIKSLDRKEGSILYSMQKVYTDHYRKTYGIDGCRIHDLLAMTLVGNRDIARGQYGDIEIRLDDMYRGETRLLGHHPKGKVHIIDEVDMEGYKMEFSRPYLLKILLDMRILY